MKLLAFIIAALCGAGCLFILLVALGAFVGDSAQKFARRCNHTRFVKVQDDPAHGQIWCIMRDGNRFLYYIPPKEGK